MSPAAGYKKFSVLIILCSIVGICSGQTRPKIGLTLSGGGAKGLAHIGILHAIDSAGLKVDYVTGTSMGSIMGALYAAGYSGDSIYQIAKSIDWSQLLSNKPSLKSVTVEEKLELGQYAVELPFIGFKPAPFTGIIEGQELWLTLNKYLLPVSDINDFSKFPRGFLCITTDIETGQPYVIRKGNITDAIRASMAIPSVFTSVEYDGRVLVDGGLLRNFPVSDVKEMGAEYIIGVNVGSGLSKASDLNSPVAVLYQITGFVDAEDYTRQAELCDILVKPDISGYSAASFGSADSIIESGFITGREYYQYFKALADSLNRLYGNYPGPDLSRIHNNSIAIDSISVTGVSKGDGNRLKAVLGFEAGHIYNADEINNKVRSLFGTRNFHSIRYYHEMQANKKHHLRFVIKKSPEVVVKAGIHFNTYSQAAIITNLTIKNTPLKRSRFYAKANISSNPRVNTNIKKYFGTLDKYSFDINYSLDSYKIPLAVDNEEFADYRAIHQELKAGFSRYFRNKYLSVYAGKSYDSNEPIVSGFINLNASGNLVFTGADFYLNSLDRPIFPRKGWEIKLQGRLNFNQKKDISYSVLGQEIPDSSFTDFGDFQTILFKSYHYSAVSARSTLFTGQHFSYLFNDVSAINHEYYLGGVTDYQYNQIPFAGLSHVGILTSSSAVFQGGWRYQLVGQIYSTLTMNGALIDFNNINSIYEITAENNFIAGGAVTMSILTLIGPVEFSLMYNSYTEKFSGYFNIGIHF